MERRDAVDGLVAEEEPHDERRRHGRDDGRPEQRHRERPDDDLEHEERRGDRRVVGARDARRHAAGRQDAHALGRDLPSPDERRRERGADLDDRTLAALRSAGRDDGDRRRDAAERLPQPHAAASERDDLDHLGDAVRAARLR